MSELAKFTLKKTKLVKIWWKFNKYIFTCFVNREAFTFPGPVLLWLPVILFAVPMTIGRFLLATAGCTVGWITCTTGATGCAGGWLDSGLLGLGLLAGRAGMLTGTYFPSDVWIIIYKEARNQWTVVFRSQISDHYELWLMYTYG